MLTNQDLKKIDGLFTKRIGEEVRSSEKRMVGVIGEEVRSSEKRMVGLTGEKIEKALLPIKKDIVKIRKDQTTIINFFDREYLDLRERVEVIERRLSIGL